MKKPDYKYISRRDDYENRIHGWDVRIQQGPNVARKFFTELKDGPGWNNALLTAVAWRNRKLKELKIKLFKGNAWGRGYRLRVRKSKGKKLRYWVVHWWDNDIKKQMSREFAVKKYGYLKAKTMAIAERKKHV